MKKGEVDASDTWSSPDDDDSSPAEDYNDFVEDQTPNDRFDDAIMNSTSTKKQEEGIKNPEKPTALNKLDKPEEIKRKTFSETWEEVDEYCPTCNKVSKPAEGLNRQNIKRLFSFQTDIQSLTILFLLIMCGLFAFSTYSYMTNPINCSNFTVMDAEIPKVYDASLDADLPEMPVIIESGTDYDYGDHTIIYPEDYPVYTLLDNGTIILDEEYNKTE